MNYSMPDMVLWFDPWEGREVLYPKAVLNRARFKKGEGSPPPAPAQPDPAATAAAQASANKEAAVASAELNMVNQVTPYGSVTYTPRGTSAGYTENGKTFAGVPQYTATQTLAPAQQAMLDLTNRAGIQYGITANNQLDSVKGRLSQPLDYSSLGSAPTIDQGAWDRATQGIISRNQPYIDKDLASLEHRLSNQGINMGSEAWNDEMRRNSAAVNDFRMAADNAGLGQAMSLYGQQASARDKAINEMMQQRTQPLNELAAMLSGSQVQGPSFIGTPQSQVNPADIMGATYAGYNTASNNYNAGANRANATNNAMMGGLFGLGSAGIGAYFG